MKTRAVAAQTRAELALTLRRGESLIVTLAIPLGILVFFAKVDAIATDYKKPVDFLVPGVLALAAALGVAPEELAREGSGEYVVHAPGTPKLIAELACHLRDQGVLLTALHSGHRSLEAVFLSLTAEAEEHA